MRNLFACVLFFCLLVGCVTTKDPKPALVAVVEGFDGPEAVLHDGDLDRYLVANFAGDVSSDANGFVSIVSPEGDLLARDFMVGTKAPFHAGRGMSLVGNALYVADATALQVFDRISGEHLRQIDLSALVPGFPNDIAIAQDGALWVTDTSGSAPRVYRIVDNEATVAVAAPQLTIRPNGIVRMPSSGLFVLAPWGGDRELVTLDPESGALASLIRLPGGGNFDGLAYTNAGDLLVASQMDQAIWRVRDGRAEQWLALAGRPADIAYDSKRNRLIIPYVSRNLIEIWQL